MLTNHYNTLSKPISPKSICCISQTSVSLYRSAQERSYLSLAERSYRATYPPAPLAQRYEKTAQVGLCFLIEYPESTLDISQREISVSL